MEDSLKDLDLAMRQPSALMVNRPQVRRTRCINFKTAGSGVVPMATVFRTLLSRQAGLESSWPARNLFKTPPLGQEALCTRRLRC